MMSRERETGAVDRSDEHLIPHEMIKSALVWQQTNKQNLFESIRLE